MNRPRQAGQRRLVLLLLGLGSACFRRSARSAWAIGGLVLLAALIYYAQFGRKAPVLYADALGYYSYLPALLLHQNAGRMHETAAALPPSIQGYFETLSQQPRSPNGYAITQYTCGVAITQLPFFAVAHAWASGTGHLANGYSAPYLAALRWSSFVYAFLGLLLAYRLLRRNFSPATAAVTVALLAAGTNLWWFALNQAGMAHPQAFFLVAAILALTDHALQKPGRVVFAGLGVCLGLLTLMRPTDLVFLLIPLLAGVGSLPTLTLRLAFLGKNRQAVIAGAVAFAAVLFPQLLFWKIYAGQWIYYSYTGQGFDWGHPHIWQGLFGFNNGWLAYSPIMGLAIAGLFFGASRLESLRDTADSGAAGAAWLRVARWFLPLYVYVTFSWWCYYYMNGFGARPMIHVYPLLAFPLAFLLEQTWRARKLWRLGLVCFSGAAVVISLGFQVQQARGNLFSEQSNALFAFSTLFQRGLCYADLVLADLGMPQPRLDEVSRLRVLTRESFASPVVDSVQAGQAASDRLQQIETSGGYVLENSVEFLPVPVRAIWSDTTTYKNIWFCCRGRFQTQAANLDLYTQQLLTLQIRKDGDDQPLHWYGCRINNKLGWSDSLQERLQTRGRLRAMDHNKPQPFLNGQANLFSGKAGIWDEVTFFVPVPKDLQPGMILEVGVWNRAGQSLWVDGLSLELWGEKVSAPKINR